MGMSRTDVGLFSAHMYLGMHLVTIRNGFFTGRR